MRRGGVFLELVDARDARDKAGDMAGLLVVLIALLVIDLVVIVLSGVGANHLALGGGVRWTLDAGDSTVGRGDRGPSLTCGDCGIGAGAAGIACNLAATLCMRANFPARSSCPCGTPGGSDWANEDPEACIATGPTCTPESCVVKEETVAGGPLGGCRGAGVVLSLIHI